MATGNCSWSSSLIPVKGSKWEKTKNGVMVKACPLFDRDAYNGGQLTLEEYQKILKKARAIKL